MVVDGPNWGSRDLMDSIRVVRGDCHLPRTRNPSPPELKVTRLQAGTIFQAVALSLPDRCARYAAPCFERKPVGIP